MEESKVSIVVPAYNAAEFLEDTLESAIAQTHKNIEVLVIDDGSQDSTAEVAGRFSPPVRVIRTENQGVAMARNTGIKEATGDFIAFLDADDLWEPDKLRLQLNRIDDVHRLVYSNTLSFGTESLANMNISGGELLPSGEIREQLIQRNFIPTSSVLMDRQIALEIGGFNPEIPVCDDWDCWLRALALTRARYVDQPLVRYRVHPSSLGSNIKKRMDGSLMVIDAALASLDATGPRKRQLRREGLSQCYTYAAILARSESRQLLALRLFSNAFFVSPSMSLVKEFAKTLLGPNIVNWLKPGSMQ